MSMIDCIQGTYTTLSLLVGEGYGSYIQKHFLASWFSAHCWPSGLQPKLWSCHFNWMVNVCTVRVSQYLHAFFYIYIWSIARTFCWYNFTKHWLGFQAHRVLCPQCSLGMTFLTTCSWIWGGLKRSAVSTPRCKNIFTKLCQLVHPHTYSKAERFLFFTCFCGSARTLIGSLWICWVSVMASLELYLWWVRWSVNRPSLQGLTLLGAKMSVSCHGVKR